MKILQHYKIQFVPAIPGQLKEGIYTFVFRIIQPRIYVPADANRKFSLQYPNNMAG